MLDPLKAYPDENYCQYGFLHGILMNETVSFVDGVGVGAFMIQNPSHFWGDSIGNFES